MNIFTAMREDLEKNGWHQGSLYKENSRNGPTCLQGSHHRCIIDDADYLYVHSVPSLLLTGDRLAAAIAELYPDWRHDHDAMKLLSSFQPISFISLTSTGSRSKNSRWTLVRSSFRLPRAALWPIVRRSSNGELPSRWKWIRPSSPSMMRISYSKTLAVVRVSAISGPRKRGRSGVSRLLNGTSETRFGEVE